MNTKNNKRRRESIKKIENIFLELLQNKELNQISITDICKRAGLNRSTFYANYADIYELADKIKERLENDLQFLYKEGVENMVNSNDYLKLFRHIKNNQLLYKTYFKLGYDNNYKIQFYDTNRAEEHFKNQHIDYHIEFFRSGLNSIIKIWLANGCEESPEAMTKIIQSEYQGR